ncbi:superinfection immunity protein [Candidatus Poriferisodalis sp.]|uniref:superinfection immunity protein n=1 Tax=Candidatus Poriferisodalis sp. TaxID=3101277 RepID=UPI003B0129DD
MILLANLDNVRWEPLLLIGGLAAGVYFLPSMVALLRRHPRAGTVIALNILGGWTVLGWLVAFFWSSWSSIDRDKAQHDSNERESWTQRASRILRSDSDLNT